MTQEQRRILRLRQWAMRASDMINEESPARASHLGGTCDYWAEFHGHVCRCGHIPATWEVTYADVLSIMKAEGIK